jgi:DNA-binding transcriptional regulator YhcF (GntR family)
VARAYRLLHEERVISTQQGRGTYVLGPPPQPEAGELRRRRLQEMIQGWQAEAERLGYSPAEVGEVWDEGFIDWTDGRMTDGRMTGGLMTDNDGGKQ